jgi:hypothetical protein
MYYTIEHNNNDYKIKVKYNETKKEYVIVDALLLSGDQEPSKEVIDEMQNLYSDIIAEMGYADSLIEQKMKGY